MINGPQRDTAFTCNMQRTDVAVFWLHAGRGLSAQRQKRMCWQWWHLASKWDDEGIEEGKLLRRICYPLALTNHQKYPLKCTRTTACVKAFIFAKLNGVHMLVSHALPFPLSPAHINTCIQHTDTHTPNQWSSLGTLRVSEMRQRRRGGGGGE